MAEYLSDSDALVEPAIALVEKWLAEAPGLETAQDRQSMQQLGDLVADDEGVGFVMSFVDRVARPDDASVAAAQLLSLIHI